MQSVQNMSLTTKPSVCGGVAFCSSRTPVGGPKQCHYPPNVPSVDLAFPFLVNRLKILIFNVLFLLYFRNLALVVQALTCPLQKGQRLQKKYKIYENLKNI